MFKSHLCGVDTAHEPGFVHKAEIFPYHLFLYFKTPFFCIINGERVQGRAGECILIKKGDKITHGSLSDEIGFVNDWIFFEENDESFPFVFNTPVEIFDGDVIDAKIEFILKEKAKRDRYSDGLISNAIYRILTEFNRAYERIKSDESGDELRFKDARAYVMAHSSNNWTLAQMAQFFGYSPSRFSAKYRQYFQKSPIDDLISERIRIAKKLLSLTSYNVCEVASMCGFSSIHYFSRCFKFHTGMPPSEYLKNT